MYAGAPAHSRLWHIGCAPITLNIVAGIEGPADTGCRSLEPGCEAALDPLRNSQTQYTNRHERRGSSSATLVAASQMRGASETTRIHWIYRRRNDVATGRAGAAG